MNFSEFDISFLKSESEYLKSCGEVFAKWDKKKSLETIKKICIDYDKEFDQIKGIHNAQSPGKGEDALIKHIIIKEICLKFLRKKNNSSLFSVNSFINFKLSAFVLRLINPVNNPVSQFLRDQFEQSTKNLLSNYKIILPKGTQNALIKELNKIILPEDQSALIKELNKIIEGASIYDKDRFSGINLSAETEQCLTQKAKAVDTVRLNKLLLENAYPQEIASNKILLRREARYLFVKIVCSTKNKYIGWVKNNVKSNSKSFWHEDQNDIMQESFLRFIVYDKLKETAVVFNSSLYEITIRTIKASIRKQLAKKRDVGKECELEENDAVEESPSPNEKATRDDDIKPFLEDGDDKLSIIDYLFLGYTLREIAEIFGKSEGAIRKESERIRETIRKGHEKESLKILLRPNISVLKDAFEIFYKFNNKFSDDAERFFSKVVVLSTPTSKYIKMRFKNLLNQLHSKFNIVLTLPRGLLFLLLYFLKDCEVMILVQRYHLGMSFKEIANETGGTTNSIQTKIKKIRKKLNDIWDNLK